MFEDVFDDVALASLRVRDPLHPCAIRYDVTNQYLDTGEGITYPFEEKSITLFSDIIIDLFSWGYRPSDDPFWSFITNASSRKFVESRISDSEAFDDVIAEIFFWMWLESEGIHADLEENEGMPDLVLDPQSECPVYSEVKHLRSGTNPERVRSIIKKANNQIKNATDQTGSGLMFIKVSRDVYSSFFDDQPPADIEQVISLIRRSLQDNMNRSVSKVIVAWDETLFVGEPPERSAFYFRRRFVVLDHPNPRERPEVSANFDGGGRTVAMRISFTEGADADTGPVLPEIRYRQATVTQLFRQENAFTGGVRASHALAAILTPDTLEHHYLDEVTITLATKRVTISKIPHTLLLLVSQKADEVPNILAAYKLYDRFEEDSELVKSPFSCFMEVLRRYGLPVKVGSLEKRFIRNAIVPLADEAPLMEVALLPAGDSGMVGGWFRIQEDSPRSAHVYWAYALNSTEYRIAAVLQRP